MAKFKTKILVVDDEPEARAALAHTLKANGYEVLEASSGKEVLRRAKTEWPALIILDIILPDIPGNIVLEQLRTDPITQPIPVLLLTAKQGVLEQLHVFDKTSDRLFEKPGRIEDLVKTVQEMLTGGTK